MSDREKVLKGLECLITKEMPCEGCPYYGRGNCSKKIAKDARELLKEQEPVEPKAEPGLVNQILMYSCGHCGAIFLSRRQKYCDNCGRAVKWDD